MGNSCLGNNINYIKDIKLDICYHQQQTFNSKSDQILIKDEDKLVTNEKHKEKEKEKENDNEKIKNKMNELFLYFNEGEKEIINNLKKNIKSKKLYIKSKLDRTIENKDDNKYELMLKRLLEQQNIKKTGPKRRKTIRKDDEGEKIQEMVKNILTENKNDIKRNKNKVENSSLLIKNKLYQKGRFSVTLDRHDLYKNNKNKKNKFPDQYFKNRNTISEVIGEVNKEELIKKETSES